MITIVIKKAVSTQISGNILMILIPTNHDIYDVWSKLRKNSLKSVLNKIVKDDIQ